MPQTLKISPNDPREYRHLVLSNQLTVLLVRDPSASKSAGAMTVKVGQFDDPCDREGMAHFLEHMLFLGTDKYPVAGEYQQFISQNGGSHNAWTGPEFTSYYFDVKPDAYHEALDRFCQFFTAPLFDEHLVDKERQSVDSEFKMKLQDDTRRFYQVHKETVNPLHPFSKFSVGNQQTLDDRDGQPVRDALIDFHQSHYSANLMTLVLVQAEPLDPLEQLVHEQFSQINNHNGDKQLPDLPLYSDNELGIEISIMPIKKARQLTITFPLGSLDDWYRHKPLTYLSYLLGHEGEGSLMSVLRQDGYIVQLSAGGGINGYNFKDYNISFQLTELGLTSIDHIIAVTFQFIKLVADSGFDQWRYQERQLLLERAFRYQEQAKPVDIACHLAVNMHHYDVEDILYGDYRMDGLEEGIVRQVLAQFTIDNIRLSVVAPDIKTDQQAKWYDTPYAISPISAERKARWFELELDSRLSLPEPNEYISDLLDPRPSEGNKPSPEVIYRNDQLVFWHKKDDEFNVPKAHLFVALDSDNCHKTCRAAAITRLYINLLTDSLTEITYAAEVAGLSYNIYPHQGGLTLHLSGFTGGQERLLAVLLQQARQRNFPQTRFDDIKQQVLRSWNGSRNARPISRLFSALTTTLQQRSYSPLDMADELETVTLDELHQHLDEVYSNLRVESMVYGDWTRVEAEGQAERLQLLLKEIGQPGSEVPRQLISIDDKGTVFREIESFHQDSAILVYYQSRSNDLKKMALFCLLNHAISSDFFHELRTKQQLGYMVGTSYVPMNRCPGIIFYIQSPVAGPLQLLEAIDQFISDFGYALMQISNKQWEETKSALANQISEQDSNLKAKAQRAWVSIGGKDFSFSQRQKVAALLSNIDRAELIRFMMERMRSRDPNRLVLHTSGSSHSDMTPLKGAQQITDLAGFKHQAKLLEF
ncbi:insulinase family protein [Ferrimonas lipolytica]|uniref:Protease 3 n=1 Tax=Ferrimonas lipolytica TaxID=2724191 RepID=A0A6H1UF46_9GAMM|nr:insulinase family protein [Ferrimonas lipolytica]QIZ77220.1 insulinase family protein [Ferrimonas lipolytica]